MTACSVEGCERSAEIRSRGICRKHYQRWRAHGDPTVASREMDKPSRCSVDGCGLPVRCRRLCERHYRIDRGPDTLRPLTDAVRARRDAFFWSNIDRESAAPCWIWTRPLTAGGYGQMRGYRGPITAHRFAYELLVGPVPDGLQLDHLCRNRACCNPEHLEPVEGVENRLRGVTARPGNGGRR